MLRAFSVYALERQKQLKSVENKGSCLFFLAKRGKSAISMRD